MAVQAEDSLSPGGVDLSGRRRAIELMNHAMNDGLRGGRGVSSARSHDAQPW